MLSPPGHMHPFWPPSQSCFHRPCAGRGASCSRIPLKHSKPFCPLLWSDSNSRYLPPLATNMIRLLLGCKSPPPSFFPSFSLPQSTIPAVVQSRPHFVVTYNVLRVGRPSTGKIGLSGRPTSPVRGWRNCYLLGSSTRP